VNEKLLALEVMIVKRLKEPSTAASIGVLAAMFHRHLSNEFLAGLVVVFGTIASVAGIFLPEKSNA
jgi:hypothetical protein